MTSNTGYTGSSGLGSTAPQVVHGSGAWEPGTTVREIEGHFNSQNEPRGAAPISETGGVPRVDYDTSIGDKAKNIVTGDRGTHGTQGTTGGLTGGSGSGLTGSGHHSSSTTGGLTGGLTGGSGSGLTGSGHHSSTTSGGESLTDRARDAVSGNNTTRSHHDNSLTGTGPVGTTGASGGLAQRAENAIDSRSSNTGTTGTHGSGLTGTAGTSGGLAQRAENAIDSRTSTTGQHGTHGAGLTGDRVGTGAAAGTGLGAAGAGGFGEVTDHRRSNAEVASSEHNTAGFRNTGDEPLTGGKHTGAHHTTGTTSAGGHGHQPVGESQTPQKEGLLGKIKHALS